MRRTDDFKGFEMFKLIKMVKGLICLMLVFAFVVNMTGCTGTTGKSDDLIEETSTSVVSEEAAEEVFINSQMRLSVDLFKKISTGENGINKNVLTSPLSIQLALAMTANGADGQTKLEMERLLGGDLSIDELNRQLYTYINRLSSKGKVKFNFANSIWIRDNLFEINENFLQTNKNYYNAQVYKEAFDEKTKEKINAWVEDNTDGMIEQIIDNFNGEEVMLLINALAFDAEWENKYEKSSVDEKCIFTDINGNASTSPMMFSSEHKYIENDMATGFVKDYAGGKYSFVALLPNEGVDIYDYINGLSGDGLLKTLRSAYVENVLTKLPKFKNEYSVSVKDILIDLGMKSAFDVANADFSEIEDSKSLYIDDVIHKTFISVDENGTKASAASAVILAKNSMGEVPWQRVFLDRPFVYMIIDNSSNLPIFIGTVVDLQ